MVSIATKFKILLVEDDSADQKLIKSLINKQQVECGLINACSAEEAFNILYSSENDGGSAKPNLIILDLNMPGMGGREFLKQIKTDNQFKRIPVVVLTCSTSEKDIRDIYNLGDPFSVIDNKNVPYRVVDRVEKAL